MARILIGNIKGPKGDTGPQGKQGPTGPQGPKGDTGPMPALINNAATTSAGVGALDAAMGKTLSDQIAVLNNKLINDSGLSLADGIYYVPYNTDADTIIWSGLYDCSGVIIDGTNRCGYMLVFAGSAYVKQIYFQNNSPLILVRQRRDGGEWSSWKELALKDDLTNIYTEYNVANNNVLFRCTAEDGSAIQLATTGMQIQLQKRTSSSGSFETVWAK